MVEIGRRKYGKRQILERVGDVSQIGGATPSVVSEGRGEGVRIVSVKTGSGLTFTVVPSRALDIAWADWKGQAIGFISKTGLCGPGLYESRRDEFHRNFFAGLLTTCGLLNTGPPCVDRGVPYEHHGRLSNIPAHDVAVSGDWTDDEEYAITVAGKVRLSKLYEENLLLSRRIETKLGSRTLLIRDRVENQGARREELMVLYHFNFGFPLLDDGAVMMTSPGQVTPRDEAAAAGLDRCRSMEKPTEHWPETVFFHRPSPGRRASAVLFNPALGPTGLGAYVRYDPAQLPWLTEWKQMGQGDYVVAMEPGTYPPVGRDKARRDGGLLTIAPGEARDFELELGMVESEQEARAIVG